MAKLGSYTTYHNSQFLALYVGLGRTEGDWIGCKSDEHGVICDFG